MRTWEPREGRSCGVEGCVTPLHTNKYCSKHYSKLRRTGSAETPNERERWDLDPIKKRLFHGAKRRAAQQGIPFELCGEDIVVPDYCPVLGIKLHPGVSKFAESSPSLDRVRPELGYVPGNVRVISWRANRIKSDSTVAELLSIVRYMSNG